MRLPAERAMRGHSRDLVLVLLLLVLLGQRRALGDYVVANCKELKRVIEQQPQQHQQQNPHRRGIGDDLRLELRGDIVYRCRSSIHISPLQSIVITGAAEAPSRLSFQASRKKARRSSYLGDSSISLLPPSILEVTAGREGETSLFINEGKLHFENVDLELLFQRKNSVLTAAQEEDAAACDTRLFRNSGELFVGRSYLSTGGNNSSCCGTKTRGRLVYSKGVESVAIIQESRLTDWSPCGGSAVAVIDGHLTVRDSILRGRIYTPDVPLLNTADDERGTLTTKPREVLVGNFTSGRLNAAPSHFAFTGGFEFSEAAVRAGIYVASPGRECESRTSEVCDFVEKMVEVERAGNTNCQACSDAHKESTSTSLAHEYHVLRPRRGLSATSGVIIDQGLLLIVLTVGLTACVVLVCFGDMMIRRRPHHPLASFFTLPRIPPSFKRAPWRKEARNDIVAEPTPARTIVFRSYAVTDDEICYVVPFDIQEALEQSAGRTRSFPPDKHNREGAFPEVSNTAEAGIVHEDVEAALRGHVRTSSRVLQRGLQGVVHPKVAPNLEGTEFQKVNISRSSLEGNIISIKRRQISTNYSNGADGQANGINEATIPRSEKASANPSPSFESAATELRLHEDGFEHSDTATVTGDDGMSVMVDRVDFTTTRERFTEAAAALCRHDCKAAMDGGVTRYEAEVFDTKQAVHHQMLYAHSGAAGTNAVRTTMSNTDTEFDGDAHHWRQMEDHIYMTASGSKGEHGVDRVVAGKGNHAPAVEELKRDSDGFHVLPIKWVPRELVRESERTRSLSPITVDSSPANSVWKPQPSHRAEGVSVELRHTTDCAPSDSNGGAIDANPTCGMSERSCVASTCVGGDTQLCSNPNITNESGPDAQDEYRTCDYGKPSPLIVRGGVLGIDRHIAIGSDGCEEGGFRGGNTVSISTEDPPLTDEDNLFYSPPSTEDEKDEYVVSAMDRARLLFAADTLGAGAHRRPAEEYRGIANFLDHVSLESEGSPFPFLSSRSAGTEGPYTFDIGSADETDGGDQGYYSETTDSVTSGFNDVQWRTFGHAAKQATNPYQS